MALVKTIKDRNTHDTIYPITKADAVYLSDNETTVEGALGDLTPTEITFTPGSSFTLGTGSSFIKIGNICIFTISGTFNTSPLNVWTNYLVGTFPGYVAKYRALSTGSDNNMNSVLLQLDADSNAIYARPLANAAHEDLIRGQIVFIIK